MKSKQVIVVNKSLNMPPGKLSAQVAHASMGALLDMAYGWTDEEIGTGFFIPLEADPEAHDFIPNATGDWLNGIFTKIVVYVKSEEKLINIYKKSKEKGLPCYLIEDSGATFFDKPTKTCVGIGPCWEDDFIGITDKLQLLE